MLLDNSRRSESYLGTFNMSSESDLEELKDVRKMVKNINQWLREEGYDSQYYVKARGRGHRQGSQKFRQDLPLQFAERVDAYIYKR